MNISKQSMDTKIAQWKALRTISLSFSLLWQGLFRVKFGFINLIQSNIHSSIMKIHSFLMYLSSNFQSMPLILFYKGLCTVFLGETGTSFIISYRNPIVPSKHFFWNDFEIQWNKLIKGQSLVSNDIQSNPV